MPVRRVNTKRSRELRRGPKNSTSARDAAMANEPAPRTIFERDRDGIAVAPTDDCAAHSCAPKYASLQSAQSAICSITRRLVSPSKRPSTNAASVSSVGNPVCSIGVLIATAASCSRSSRSFLERDRPANFPQARVPDRDASADPARSNAKCLRARVPCAAC